MRHRRQANLADIFPTARDLPRRFVPLNVGLAPGYGSDASRGSSVGTATQEGKRKKRVSSRFLSDVTGIQIEVGTDPFLFLLSEPTPLSSYGNFRETGMPGVRGVFQFCLNDRIKDKPPRLGSRCCSCGDKRDVIARAGWPRRRTELLPHGAPIHTLPQNAARRDVEHVGASSAAGGGVYRHESEAGLFPLLLIICARSLPQIFSSRQAPNQQV